MSVLSGALASRRLKDGSLAISPKPHVKRTAAAIDLRLGRWFISMRDSRLSMLDIRSSGVEGEFEVRKHAKETFVPFGEAFILHPGRFVLASTLEWVTLPNDLMAFVTGKSSWARRGLSVEGAPGVHPGFSGCLTLEVANHGVVPIEILSGMEICQLFLLEMSTEQTEADATLIGPKVNSNVHGMRRKPSIAPIDVDPVVTRLKRSKER